VVGSPAISKAAALTVSTASAPAPARSPPEVAKRVLGVAIKDP